MRRQVQLFLLSYLALWVEAQQKPTLQLPQFLHTGNETFRQDVCNRYRAHASSGQSIEYALEGLEIHTAVVPGAYILFDESGALDPDYPGLVVEIMDEVAKRAHFTWRESYGVLDYPEGNHTWTDVILWSTEYYDVSVDWFAETLERLKLGMSFPHGWYDASYILVGAKQGEDEHTVNYWGWTQPFTPGVWVCIAITIVLSGVIFTFLEYIGNADKRVGTRRNLGIDIYMSTLLFSQHFEYAPTSKASRMFAASMALWALLVSSAYTANLASFFVIQNTPNLPVASIEDAIREGLPLCVYDTTVSAMYIEKRYPKAILVRKKYEIDLYHGVNDGECALAVASASGFQEFERDQRTNADCRLTWIGRDVQKVDAGFVTKSDSGKLCTSLIHDVLNLHLLEIESDGTLRELWEKHLSRSQDQDCSKARKVDYEGEEDLGRRTVDEMAGTFLLHVIITVAALIVAVGDNLWKKQSEASVLEPEIKVSSSTPEKGHPGVLETPALEAFLDDSTNVKMKAPTSSCNGAQNRSLDNPHTSDGPSNAKDRQNASASLEQLQNRLDDLRDRSDGMEMAMKEGQAKNEQSLKQLQAEMETTLQRELQLIRQRQEESENAMKLLHGEMKDTLQKEMQRMLDVMSEGAVLGA